MGYFIRNLVKYREYIFHSAKAQLKSELSNSAIGWIWWVLEPTLYMIIYLFVYTIIFQRKTEYAVAVINIGLLYWRFFNSCVIASTKIVRKNRSIISKVYIPKFVLICTVMLVNMFKMVFASVPIVILLIWYKVPLTWHMIQVIPITAVFFIVVFACSCWCMHIGVYFQDLERLTPVLMRMLFYLSGVFYPIDSRLGATAAKYLICINPIAAAITDVRNSLLYGIDIHWTELGIHSLIFLFAAFVGILAIRKKENHYIKIV